MLKYIFSALLIAAVWGATHWFELEMWMGIAATCAILFVLISVVMYRVWRARRSAKEIERALRAQGDAQAAMARPALKGQVDAMQDEFQKAVAALKASNVGGRGKTALYAMPWYMIIGPPGAGKSTALANSGLRFPYLSDHGRGGAVRGVGGTRNCDWWMTNRGVILDTAGRYTSQEEDRDEWFSFLELLRRTRSHQPINGIIVAISIADLLESSREQITSMAKGIRARVDELMVRLDVIEPVYVLFTKCDLLAGFVETFEELEAQERHQIWGFTCPLTGTRTDPAVRFVSHFDRLTETLERRTLRRMGQERRPAARSKIHAFPQHFASLRAPAAMFLGELFAQSVYHDNPLMRGVYFTSGTQEGSPIDRITSSVAEAFGLHPSSAAATGPIEARSYFLGQVFERVIFPDRKVASRSTRRTTVRRWMQFGIAAGILLLSLGMTVFPVRSFRENRNLISTANQALATLIGHYRDEASVKPVPPETLRPLAAVDGTLAQYQADGVPMSLQFGMYEGDTLAPALRNLFMAVTRKELAEPTLAAARDELRAFVGRHWSGSSSPPHDEFRKHADTLRMVLLLSWTDKDRGPGLDDAQQAWLAKRLAAYWAQAYAAAGIEAGDDRILGFAQRYAAILAGDPTWALERDEDLVRNARTVLQRTDRVSAMLAQLVQSVNEETQDLGLRDFVAPSAIQNGNRRVQGAFTQQGWIRVRKQLDEPLQGMSSEAWVLGRSGGAEALQAEELDELRSRYFELYIQEWDQLIGSIYVQSPQNYVDALTMMQDLTRGPTPSFAALLQHLAHHTRLTSGDEQKDALVEGAKAVAGKVAKKKLKKGPRGAADQAGRMLQGGSHDRLLDVEDVEEAFADLVRFGVPPIPPPAVEGAPPPPPEAVALDVYQEQLTYLRDALQARIEDPNEQEALATRAKAARARVKSLLAEQNVKWRPRLETLLWPPIEAIWALAGQSAVADLENTWCQNVVTPLATKLLPRYPFRPDGYDVTLEEFSAFFAPGEGALWQFYQAALAAKVPQEGDRFTVAEQGEASRTQIHPGLVGFLNSARDIGVAAFPSGAQPKTEFDVQIGGTPNISETTFTVDGVSVSYRNGPESWQRLQWPGEGDKAGASIRARGFGINGFVEQEGPWGLFRLFELGTVAGDSKGRVFTVRWNLTDQGAGTIAIKIRPTRRDTPFFGVSDRGGGFLALFRSEQLVAPRSVVVGGPACATGAQ